MFDLSTDSFYTSVNNAKESANNAENKIICILHRLNTLISRNEIGVLESRDIEKQSDLLQVACRDFRKAVDLVTIEMSGGRQTVSPSPSDITESLKNRTGPSPSDLLSSNNTMFDPFEGFVEDTDSH